MERKWQLHTSHSEQCLSLHVTKYRNSIGRIETVESRKSIKLPYTWGLSRSIQLTAELKIKSHYSMNELEDIWELQNRINSLRNAARARKTAMTITFP